MNDHGTTTQNGITTTKKSPGNVDFFQNFLPLNEKIKKRSPTTKGMYDKPKNHRNDKERPPKMAERPLKKTWKC